MAEAIDAIRAKAESALEGFERGLPFRFIDRELLKKVFVHKSFLNESHGYATESYERLEFLGDAVLSVVIGDMLFKRFPEADEGVLTTLRARLVNRKTLSELSKGLGLGEYVLMGKGEEASGGRENKVILAGVFEALMAAVYLERGFGEAFSFIDGLYSPVIEEILRHPRHFGFKSELQALSQRLFKEGPSYRVVEEEGPPHRKLFTVEAVLKGRAYGRGTAPSKKEAEELAAEEAIKEVKREEAMTE